MAVLGLDAKVKWGAAGAQAATALDNVISVSVNLTKAEADVTTRDSGGWRTIKGTVREASIDIELLYEAADAGFEALRDSYLNGTAVALLILDSATGEALDADFEVLELSREEPLEDSIKYMVTVKPTASSRTPAWVEPS